MSQQFAAPSHRRTTLIAVALLLVALAVGAVAAVSMFPTQASDRAIAGPVWHGPLGRLDNRSSVAAPVWHGPLGRLDNRSSVAAPVWHGPLGRLDNRSSVAAPVWHGPLGR